MARCCGSEMAWVRCVCFKSMCDKADEARGRVAAVVRMVICRVVGRAAIGGCVGDGRVSWRHEWSNCVCVVGVGYVKWVCSVRCGWVDVIAVMGACACECLVRSHVIEEPVVEGRENCERVCARVARWNGPIWRSGPLCRAMVALIVVVAEFESGHSREAW